MQKESYQHAFINFGFNKMAPKLKAHQSKWSKWKVIKFGCKWNYPNWNLYKICAHSKLDNDGKTQQCGSNEGIISHYMSQPYFGQVCGWSPTLEKSEDLESSGTPECSELNSKAQNTLHWGVLGVIGKALKRRYRKWPCIGHLNICSPSYGQKKGRESNWQFDSRPLKVGNRPLPDLWIESATRRWKDLDEGYKFGSDLVAIRLRSLGVMSPQSPGTPPGTVSGQLRDSNPGVPEKSDIRAWEPRRVIEYTIGSKVVAYSRVRAVVTQVSPIAHGLSQHPKVSRNVKLTTWVVCFLCRFKLDLLVPLPSLIPGLPTRPSTPF
jgi:hypothetical protein